MAGPSVSLLSWLRPESVHVFYAERSWELTARMAADWIGAIAIDREHLSGVFPGMIKDEDLDAMQKLLPSLDIAATTAVARNAVQAAAGRDWWWTVNLVSMAIEGWFIINGVLVRQGIRSDSTMLGDWLDACYTWMLERHDEDGRKVLEFQLNAVPKGVKMAGRAQRKMLEDFAAD